MTRVLVTGGMGFIGSHTVDCLVEKGYDVTVLDNLERQVHRGLKPTYLNPKATYETGDLRFTKSWVKALNGVESVIHLGAVVGVAQSFWEARKYSSVNVTGTATFFQLLLKDGGLRKRIGKIVVASSKSIYGEGAYLCKTHGLLYPDPRPVSQLKSKQWEVRCNSCDQELKPVGIDERKPPQNLSPYALSKYATERLAMDFSLVTQIPTVAFRYFNVFGPRQSLNNPYTGVVSIFLSRLKNRRAPIIFEDGQQLRDLVYVEDVANLNVEALEEGVEGVFNLGTGKPHSLLEIVEMLKRLVEVDIDASVTNEFRPSDNRHDFADASKLNAHFKQTSFTSLERGLGNLVRWSAKMGARDRFWVEERERNMYFT